MATGVLIRSFGEYWRPDRVNWGKPGPGGSGELLGEFGPARRRRTVDVWAQRGVYILHDAWEVVYVGKADGTDLGSRLKAHLKDRHAGRWDRFSWYGVIGVVSDGPKKGKLGTNPASKSVSTAELIDTLESFLLAVEPPRNRRREKIPNATEVFQAQTDPPMHLTWSIEEIKTRLISIEETLESIRDVIEEPDR